MKIKEIHLKNFKRFADLEIVSIPPEAKLVVLVGPNGSGKSSLFEAFFHWYKMKVGFGAHGDNLYYQKNAEIPFQWNHAVQISFHDAEDFTKACMNFRTAYRNDSDFNVQSLNKQELPYEQLRFQLLIDNDMVVNRNYQRLVYDTVSGIYSPENDGKLVKELREELIGKLRSSLITVFGDLILNNIADPLGKGSFYFEKGSSKSFHYKNLSGGEKAAFDLLLDIILKQKYYDNSVFCIDEPELHMHTETQIKLLRELVSIISDQSQLWITTHSLGMLSATREIMTENPETACILDFSAYDFDEPCTIRPVRVDKACWEKFLSVTIGKMSLRIAAKSIFLCEGSFDGRDRRNFDADIYNVIFADKADSEVAPIFWTVAK